MTDSAVNTLAIEVDEFVDRVARRVIELLDERQECAAISRAGMVDAAAVASMLGISRNMVYEHAADWGAVKVGRNLRFDREQVLRRWSRRDTGERSQALDPEAASASRRPRKSPTTRTASDLLPIGGKRPR